MNGTAASAVTLALGVVAAVAAGLRWLRVAQREHYLAGSVSRFAARWWTTGPLNPPLAGLALASLVAGIAATPVALLAAVAAGAGPVGLGLRGRTAPLVWTARLRLLAGVAAAFVAVPVGAVAAAGLRPAAVVACLASAAVPALVDLALLATRPLERRRLAPFLTQATGRLRAVHPTVVAITGSYGKTSTKGYVAHLLAGTRSVVPTPRSFNNLAGLARAINQHLAPGTDVFVAEMGTYGPGEIAELCRLVPPDVSVITAIGPVHLERMGSEERIAEAKSEILEKASVAVLNVDHPLLAELADRSQVDGKKVWRCRGSEQPDADIWAQAEGGVLVVNVPGSRRRIEVPGCTAPPTNVACAVAVAVELGVPLDAIAERLTGLPAAEHRQTVTTGSKGQRIIDDTYNANPAGAAAALRLLDGLAPTATGHKRVVVTPGMVELGRRQRDENAAFARAASRVATHIVVVGSTNAAALLEGARAGGAQLVRVRRRDEAVAWVAANTGPGDAVLYENDLPDHFP